MEFCLKRNTVCINIMDQTSNELVKRLVFFGDIPDKIRKIINHRDFNSNESILAEYFGKRWKEKLHIKFNTKSIKDKIAETKSKGKEKKHIGKTVHQGKSQRNIVMARNEFQPSEVDALHIGGQHGEQHGEQPRDVDALDETELNRERVDGATSRGGFEFDLENATEVKVEENTDKLAEVNYDESVTYITNITLFPEDTFWTLKEKIYLATNIPTYRQYIYQRVKSNDPNIQKSGHSIYISESLYNIDMKQDTELFNGIMIDKNMYNNREHLRIKTKEPYKMIDSMIVDDIYLADLQFYRNKLINVESIINSNYESDVLYYGLFKKYYPIFNRDMMIKYLVNEAQVLNEYPLINTNKSTLKLKYETEQEILYDVYNNIDRYFDKFADDIELSISEIIYKLMDNYIVQNGIFIRNLIDLIPCDANYPFIECYNTKNNIKYRIIRYYKNQNEHLIKNVLDDKVYKIVDEISIYFWDSKYKQLNKFTINANAIYTISVKYLRSDGVDFSDSLENITFYANNIIDIINKNKRLVFNPNFTFVGVPKFDKETTVVTSVRVNVKWNNIVTQQQFAQVSESLKKFYIAGIAEHRVLSIITPNVINIRMKKGISQQINRFFLKKRVEVKDYYVIFHDIKSREIWNIRYGGKNINIENNLTDITFEFVNIADKEFIRVINYVLYIINDIDKHKSQKEIVSKTNVEHSKKSAMKKMKALDPKLYNFAVSGSTKAVKYSRICQKKFRPINIYTEEEFKLLNADNQKKLHQFINYTTGEPVWYECPNSLPYFGFITGKHPSGYCLPKCKSSETSGNKNKAIKQACMEKHSFEKKTDTTGVLKFGKLLGLDKVGFLHEKIYELFSMLTDDNSAHLFMKAVPDNYAGVPGSKILCCFAEQSGKTESEIIQQMIDYQVKLRDKNETLIGILNEILTGNVNIIEDMHLQFEKLIQQVFNVHIVYINTSVSIQNEILNSQNSSVYLSMDSSCSTYLSRKQNVDIIIIQRLYDNIYPVLYTENKLNKTVNEGYASKERKIKQTDNVEVIVGDYVGIFDINSLVVDVLQKAINRKLIKTEYDIVNKPFTYYSLRDKIGDAKFIKYISNGYIKYIVSSKLGICVGVSNSVNILEGEETHDVFVRKDHDLPFAKLSSFLESFKSINPIILVLNNEAFKLDEISDDDIAIGIRVSNINCWFNDTKVKKVRERFPSAAFQLLVVDPSDVNLAISKRSAPKQKYMNNINNVYYEIYIYRLLKYELYKYILLQRDVSFRNRILKDTSNKEFINELNEIKQENKDDYYKILNIINNSNDIRGDLNKVLLNHDVTFIIDRIQKLSDKELKEMIIDIVGKIIIKTNEIVGDAKNVIVSYIDYTSNKTIIDAKHEEDLFYKNNRIKLLKSLYDTYIDGLFRDLKNNLVLTYEINNFNIFFIINYLQFTPIAGTSIHVQFL